MSSLDTQRAEYFTQIQRALSRPAPGGMAHAMDLLQKLGIHVAAGGAGGEDSGQREARLALIKACETSGASGHPGSVEQFRTALHTFEMRWRDETGRMIISR